MILGPKHLHVCTDCGRMVICRNFACTDGDLCPQCEEKIGHE